MTALIGLDIGTTSVKGIAVAPDGEVLAVARTPTTRCRTPRPGWAEQDPEDWWRATEEALGALAAATVAGIGLSGQMHGLVTLDAADRVRSARRSSGTTSAPARSAPRSRSGRLRPARRADRQPRADRLHRAEAAVAAQARARQLRAHRARDAAQGLRAAAADRRAGDRRRRRLRHAAARRRRTGAGATRCSTRSRSTAAGCRPCSSRPRSSGRTAGGVAGRGGRAATRRRAGSASASTGPGPLSVAMGTSGVVFAALPEYAPTRRRASHAFCHAVPGRLAPDGRDALGRGLARAGCATSSAASASTR